ncbi:MAG: hypothetical protein Q7S75_02315 [bacterium]|nr:hypothetical protein [bacterium]
MPVNRKIFGYVLVLIAAFMFVGLAGWYFFLNQQSKTITATDASRGLGSDDSSFKSTVGNTYNNIVSGITTLINGTSTPETQSGTAPPQLWQITKTPVAGMAFVGTGLSTRLYFAESSTGYVLTANPETGALMRLTNKLLPKTQEAVFAGDGSVVLRSVNDTGDIVSFAGVISSSTELTKTGGFATFSGKYLERNISAIVSAPYTRELLYIKKDSLGGAVGTLSSWDGVKKKNIFSSPISGWRSISLADGRAFFVLQPADNVPGFAYELKSNGTLAPQVRGVPGLTFLPNTSSTAVLYGESENGSLTLFARVRDDATTFSLPIRTVADKCVWSTETPAFEQSTTTAKVSSKKPSSIVKPLIAYCAVPQFVVSNTFLNDWYKGAIHTSDSWWRVDVSADTVELIFQGEPGRVVDVENPVMDGGGKYIAFVNSADKTLWLLRLKPEGETTKTTP